MFIIKKKDNKKILVSLNSARRSKLVKIEKIKDESGKTENIYHYEVFIDIDKRHAIEKDLQTIEIEKSEQVFQKVNKREKLFDNIDTANPKSINLVASNALKIKLDQTINKKSNLKIKKIGSVSSDTVFNSQNIGKLKSKILTNKSEKEIFGTIKRLSLFEKDSNNSRKSKKNLLLIPKIKKKNKKERSSKFRSKYSKLLSAGIDPATRISKIIKDNTNQGFQSKRKGRFIAIRKIKNSNGVFNYLGNVLKDSKLQNQDFQNDNSHSLQLIEKNARIGRIKHKVKINEKQLLDSLNDEVNLIFTVRDKNGVAIESIPGVIKHKKQKEEFKFPKFNFEVEANKTSSGQVTLKIINNEHEERSFNVYSRQLNEYLPHDQIKYELKTSNVRVPRKSSIILFRRGYHFKSNRPVFFRVNAVHEQREYANSKFASIETGRKLASKNYAGLSAIIQNERIAIQARNLSSSIKKIEMMRRDLTKRERNFKKTKSFFDGLGTGLNENRGKMVQIDSLDNVFTFYDDDVEYNHTYEYKALLYDDNGNKSLSSTSAIENYSKPHGVIDLEINKRTNNIRNNIKTMTLSGTVKRKVNDADKVFQDLFGRFYELFEEDLKTIKDLNAITINLLLEMINRETSEVVRLTDVSVNSSGEFRTSLRVPADSDVAIKITPRLMPPAEILSKINSNLPMLASKNRFLPVSAFNTAAIKRKTFQGASRFVSAMGDKHSQRDTRFKGKITDSKTQLNKTNFDAYYDGNTGDVRYVLEDTIEEKDFEKILITLSNKRIQYLELDSKQNVDDNARNINLKREYFLARFSAKNTREVIDHFVMSYEENGNSTIQGLAFNTTSNERMRINYLFDTPVLYGKISFYAQPIMKNGKIQSPILIKTIYKDDEGIK